ncbi:MAG TPA: thiamine-phosphate kinase [Chthoniobacteraceae bacterium]|nr:thiamine-phosphate kinase [Chthoniobacteraceae bacterium]
MSKRLVDVGEDWLVARLLKGLPGRADVLVGPGDDCAVIGRPRAKVWQLLKTDCLIENVHFTRKTEAKRVGWKALCRAISDIGAMAGQPAHALITLAMPNDLEVRWVDDFYAGLGKAARRFGVAITGGETARSPGPIFISVALTGQVERRRCVLRSGGQPGDAIYVTGRLGGSIARKHLDFIPRVAEARWISDRFKPTSMMDLSDGLGTDLPRLAGESGCGYRFAPGLLPRTKGCTIEQAISDGEDYELLFTVTPSVCSQLESAWRREFRRLPLTRIGELLQPSRTRKPATIRGFDHFAPAK